MCPTEDDEYYPTTLFGARLIGIEGWVVREEPMTLPQIEEIIRQSGQEIIEIREIIKGASRYRDEEGRPDMSNVDYSSAITYGWAFDDVVGCWRAPGENVAPFESETKIVDGISISFGASDVGWIPIHIAAGDQTIDIHATDSDTPFGNLVDCLEQVADGKVARFSADLEGSYLEFFAFEGSMANRVRIVIGKASNSNQPGEREITLDFDIGRKAFVDSVYRALRAYAEGPDYNPYEWAAISIHDDLQRNNPNFPIEKLAELSSSEINDLLWKLYPRYSVSFPNKATDGEQAVTFAKWALTGQKKDPKGMIRTPDPQFEACLSGCHPYPLHLGCSQSPE